MPVVGVVAVVGVVPFPVAVEPPPHAARSMSAHRATRENKIGLSCFCIIEIPKVVDLFDCIFFFFRKGISYSLSILLAYAACGGAQEMRKLGRSPKPQVKGYRP